MMELTKKEQFLQTSLELIHEKGFKATTMRDIAERMQFDKSNSYNYINSKYDILEESLLHTSKVFHDEMDKIIASSYAADDKLKLVISAHIRVASQKPYHVALMVNEWRNLKEPKYSEYISLRDLYEKKLETLIREGINSKIFKSVNSTIATAVILSSIRWLYDAYACDKNAMNPIELERQIVGLVFNGMLRDK